MPIRPTRAEIDLSALRHNFRALVGQAQPTTLMTVVKANAYGHGAIEVASELSREGARWFGVALVEEALALREAGIDGDIVVFGGCYEGAYDELIQHRLTPFVFTMEHIKELVAAAHRRATPAVAHLKVDTGMGRIGVRWDELEEFLKEIRSIPENDRLKLTGIASHFANADLADAAVSGLQHQRFIKASELIRSQGFEVKWRHLANSAAVNTLPDTRDGKMFNMVRPGLMLYGISPAPGLEHGLALRPVLRWKTAVHYLKRVPTGTPISYGGQWVSKRPSLIATLPLGYADGYSRMNSNRSNVLIRGQRAPIVGRVCMDMCMADVTDVEGVSLHDEVMLLGLQDNEEISAAELAAYGQTIPYEIVCSISARVPRIYK